MKRMIAISMMFALLIQGLNPTVVQAAWEEFPTVGGLERETLIKTADSSAVYYFSINEQRYAFPDEQTFRTWYADFDSVRVIDQSVMDQIPYAGFVTVHPYAYMIQFYGETDVYAVGGYHTLQHIESEEVAEVMFGNYWWHRIVSLPGSQKSLYAIQDSVITEEDVETIKENRYASDSGQLFGKSIGFENVHFDSPDGALLNAEAAGVYIYEDPYRFAASDESVDCGEYTCSYNMAYGYEGGALKFVNRTSETVEVVADDGSWQTGKMQPGDVVIISIEQNWEIEDLLYYDTDEGFDAFDEYPIEHGFHLDQDTAVKGSVSVELYSISALFQFFFMGMFGVIGI